MEDHHQWFYNNSAHYQSVGTSAEYNQYQTNSAPIQYNHWNQSQSNSTFVPYPPVPSYPPPVAGPYSVPPPNIAAQSNFGYCYNYPSHQPVNQNQYWPNDYTKELENYKYIKSKIEEGTPESKVKESMDPNGNGATGETRDVLPASRKSQAPENPNPQDLDFVYGDCDTYANEIAELYSYTEYSDLHYNLSAFEEQMAKHRMSYMTWRHFTMEEKTSIVMKILDQLEFSNKETRMKSARCILYIAQGGWLGVQSDKEQLDSAKESCLLLYKLGAFSAFVDLLNLEIDNRNTVKKSSVSLVDSDDLRVILSVLYTITETIRSEKESEPAIYNAFCSDLMNTSEDDLLVLKLFNMLTKFCSGVSPHFPVKKILLLMWKLILLSLGGTEEMRQLKQEKRYKAGLQPQDEDTIEIVKTLRPSSPPAFAADLLEDQNQRRKRSLVKQSSLEDNETIDMDEFENDESHMKNTQNNQDFNKWPEITMSPERNNNSKLPWKPKAHKRLTDMFLNGAREKFIGYSLEGDTTTLFGLPKPIHESVKVLKEHTYVSLTELQIQREENINRNPLTNKDDIDTTATEILYQAMFPNLPQYMICLLKILLATTSRTKTNNDSINILGDVLPKDMPMTVFQSMKLGIDVNRHKEIIVKAVSAILLLLLKHFKLSHVYQFEFMSQHLVFANCIPLILKFFNQEIINYVKAGNNIPVLDFPSCVLGDFQPDLNGTIEIGGDANHCWRNVFSSINLLRVLNKLCKWKNSRIMMLVIFKSAPILKRTLKIRHAMPQLYVLKLLKMQAKYLGRNWRKSNLKTVSLIYQKVRHYLNDDWAYGNYLDAKPWDFQAEEITLRTAVDKFNNRRYGKNIEEEFESVDNNLNSVLGHDFDLSTNFQKHYDLWLEDEVFNNEVEWEKLSRSSSPKSSVHSGQSNSRDNVSKRPRYDNYRSHYDRRNYRERSREKSRERDRRRDRSGDRKSRSSGSSYGAAKIDKWNSKTKGKPEISEREEILSKWRKNYCSTEKQITDKLEELATMTTEDILEKEKSIWTRTTPAELYYIRDERNSKIIRATPKLVQLTEKFHDVLVQRAARVNELKPKYEPPPRKNRARLCKHKTEVSSSSDSSEEDLTDEEDCTMEELQRKQQHPDRLHPEMWFNEPGEMNDGPLCRCSIKSRKSGIRHGIYPGEVPLQKCDSYSNNADKLYHYRITISPPTNFLIKTPTIIQYDEHEFIFEGFSMFSHFPLEKLPTCKVIRFNIEYTILYIEEKIPENFTVHELDLFNDFLFKEILELVDLDFKAAGDQNGCSQYHFMPRFVRELAENGKEILCMEEVLQYLLNSSKPLIENSELVNMVKMTQYEWQSYADEIKGMVVTYPGKKPCSVRVDQLDRNIDFQKEGDYKFPEIVHFGIRPPQLSYAGNPEYQKAWRDYVKFRHLLANMSKPTFEDKRKLEAKENKLQEMRTQGKMKRDVTVAVSSEGFYRTGIMCDVIQHAMLLPVLVCHLRFHYSLNVLEESVIYKFKNRALLQLALTHPSYRENFGTNPDHARNSLTNCGIRQPEYGDRRIHYMNTRKRGINTLINIMSRFGKQQETESNITHNERLEFLGDAVVEFLSSIHLFYSFPDLEEGGLATYRAAIVQNQHLAVLARTLKLDQFMLYAHGSDLCHDLELRHAMANCFEALMGSLFLDGGIEVADKVFSATLFHTQDRELYEVWVRLPPHPLQEQEPLGDRQWIDKFELLQNLVKFEQSINVEFKHIRLLARAFTDRSVGYTNLTMGSNQRLEFLGDTVLQLIASEYLYKYFPEHHEGHLSLLRSSLVNNRTQAVVCDDLGMAKYAVYNNPKAELKTKDRADLLEAFIGALYVDQGMEFCEVFCQVTLFPRLQDFIMNQDWNDPKSKLQQCCLTLRTMDGGEPDIPVYKVIECKGPTNTRVYTVAVYFRGRRLASAMGHSIQQAEMNAAKKALEISQDLFPQLDHQKRVIAKSMKKQRKRGKSASRSRSTASVTKSPKSYSRSRFRRSRSRTRSKSREKESRIGTPGTSKKRSTPPREGRKDGSDIDDGSSDSEVRSESGSAK